VGDGGHTSTALAPEETQQALGTSSSSKRKGIETDKWYEGAQARESSCAASLNYSDDTAAAGCGDRES
jgi:hypothetical protein